MANKSPLDNLLTHLGTTDTKVKIQIGTDIKTYLEDPTAPVVCEDIDRFFDGVVTWLHSSNFKVAQNGLEILTLLVDKMGEDFRYFLPTLLPSAIDRLGDQKDIVRQKTQNLLMALTKQALSPAHLLEKMMPAFSHKNGKVREEALMCLCRMLDEYGSTSMALSKVMPSLVKLLSDPTPLVRDATVNTLVEIYRHVGERVRSDIQRKYSVPAARITILMQKFDEVRDAGEMLETANITPNDSFAVRGEDEADRSMSKLLSKNSNVPAASGTKRSSLPLPKPSAATTASTTGAVSVAAVAGAVDEDSFSNAFEDAPVVTLFSARELEDHCSKIREALGDASLDWTKRVEFLRYLRSLILAGALDYDEFCPQLKLLALPMQAACRDLRSQVVREACISIAFVAQCLGQKSEYFVESLLPALINLLPNSARVVASSGLVTLRYVLRHVHAPRLLPHLTQALSSKSRDIRKSTCELLALVLVSWPLHALEKHNGALQEALKKGVADADADARLASRGAFWAYAELFPSQADTLLSQLDSSQRKQLQSGATATGSLPPSVPRTRVSSNVGSTENLHKVTSLPRKPVRSRHDSGNQLPDTTTISPLRSTSAIDLQAAQRAKARAQYAAAARQRVAGAVASLPRPRKLSESGGSGASTLNERVGRPRSRSAGISQSQPSSRSGSPSSRLSYATYTPSSDSRQRWHSGAGPGTHSTGSSREPSPNRWGGSYSRRIRSQVHHPATSTVDKPPLMAQRILQQSWEAETALADALTGPRPYFPRPGQNDDHSDESENSSVCSERSGDAYRRPSDPYSWSGSQQRLAKDNWDGNRDISDVISACASTHWSDRKEGLVSLQQYLRNRNLLSPHELRKITEIFSRMFMDSHTKVFSLFLDTLMDLIALHKADLNGWLYILLARIFNKLGNDLLGSVQAKLYRTLDVIRESFTSNVQFAAIARYFGDTTQLPSAKVKVAVLHFLQGLCEVMESTDILTAKDPKPTFSKIVTWAQDVRNADVRKAAQTALTSLFEVNPSEVTRILSQLPDEIQKTAAILVQRYVNGPESCPSPGYSSSPIGGSSPGNVEELSNPEDVQRSLRRTTAEIQNYSFDALDLTSGRTNSNSVSDCGGTKLGDRDATSQDSGISQMSVTGDRVDGLEERLQEIHIGGSGRSSGLSSPSHKPGAGFHYPDLVRDNGFACSARDYSSGADIPSLMTLVETLNTEAETSKERITILTHIVRVVREGSLIVLVNNFKHLLRSVLEQLKDGDSTVRALALTALTEMLRKPALVPEFKSFNELLILRVLDAHDDEAKDVVRMAEKCGAAICRSVPLASIVSVLCPIIETGSIVAIQAAIKMLSRLPEVYIKDQLLPAFPDIMKSLLKAYDHAESSVRKAAVFCMVAYHQIMEEDVMNPYLVALNNSKLKLLYLYIKRFNQGSGASTPSKKSS